MAEKFEYLYFNDVDLNDSFFDSLKDDYGEFSNWFCKKIENEEKAFVLKDDSGIAAFLYLKDENEEIVLTNSILPKMNRIKIGTLKLSERIQKQRLGEGAIGISLWNWQKSNAEEIYVTIFEKHNDLISLFEKFGFVCKGYNRRGEVFIREVANNNEETKMDQAYTCVTIDTELYDFRATLSENQTTKIIPLKVENADGIKSINISWYSDNNGTNFNYNNLTSSNLIRFNRFADGGAPTPSTISAQLVQTANTFNLDQLMVSRVDSGNTKTGTTDNGTIFFVPTSKPGSKHAFSSDKTSYDISKDNILTASDDINFVTASSKASTNVPVSVYCPENSGNEFACSISVSVPRPIPGPDGSTARNSDTFMLIVTVPYGRPETNILVQACTSDVCLPNNPTITSTPKRFLGAQISVDSTGRANNLYRRVETRLETFDPNFPIASYALQISGNGKQSILKNRVSDVK